MKQSFFAKSVIALFIVAAADILFAYPNGVSGYTLKTNANGCGACHSTHSSPNITVTGVISGPVTLKPGQTGNYTVRISGGNGTKVGVDISASTGTLATADGNLKLLNGELTQPSSRSYSSGSYTFKFKFTAPAVQGPVTLYATCMSTKTYWNFAPNFTVNVEIPFISPPTSLTSAFVNITQPKVDLLWADNSTNETGFRLERKTGSGAFELLKDLPANTISYSDTSLALLPINYTYRVCAVNADTISAFSNETSVFVNLPVEMISFSCRLTGSDVMLEWVTATEINNRGFEIERKSEESGWVTIGFVSGYGTTTEKKYYSFVDSPKLIAGNVSYRLKQTDLDGSFEYSGEISLKTKSITPESLSLDNFPNPFNPSTVIRYSVPDFGGAGIPREVKLVIYDLMGNIVSTLVNETRSPDVYEIIFDAGKIPSGPYFCLLSVGNFNLTKKMILIK